MCELGTASGDGTCSGAAATCADPHCTTCTTDTSVCDQDGCASDYCFDSTAASDHCTLTSSVLTKDTDGACAPAAPGGSTVPTHETACTNTASGTATSSTCRNYGELFKSYSGNTDFCNLNGWGGSGDQIICAGMLETKFNNLYNVLDSQ